mmetsp:Transcript_26930/g.42621  ORF Transcript_26930/g.42621 Transcript_26930/m.42621 type:complete len:279 (+) Transcript_26930:1158-1994(+)
MIGCIDKAAIRFLIVIVVVHCGVGVRCTRFVIVCIGCTMSHSSSLRLQQIHFIHEFAAIRDAAVDEVGVNHIEKLLQIDLVHLVVAALSHIRVRCDKEQTPAFLGGHCPVNLLVSVIALPLQTRIAAAALFGGGRYAFRGDEFLFHVLEKHLVVAFDLVIPLNVIIIVHQPHFVVIDQQIQKFAHRLWIILVIISAFHWQTSRHLVLHEQHIIVHHKDQSSNARTFTHRAVTRKVLKRRVIRFRYQWNPLFLDLMRSKCHLPVQTQTLLQRRRCRCRV